MTKPELSVVETLYESNCRDVVRTVTRLARDIRSGEYGDVKEVLAIVRGTDDSIRLFGIGEADAMSSIALLEISSHRLKNIMQDLVA